MDAASRHRHQGLVHRRERPPSNVLTLIPGDCTGEAICTPLDSVVAENDTSSHAGSGRGLQYAQSSTGALEDAFAGNSYP